MKKLILLLLLSLTACQNVTYKDTKVNAVITFKDSTKACDKYEYYYGYSMIDGHYCWHWGMNHHDPEYKTKIVVYEFPSDADTITVGQTNHKVGDTIQVTKTSVFVDKKLVDTRYSTNK